MNFIFSYIKHLMSCCTTFCVVLLWILSACNLSEQSQVHDVTGHLPDLYFSLTSDTQLPVTNKKVSGKLVLLFFGFTHCRTECPTTMFRLAKIVKNMGNNAKQISILFATLDPLRDTPNVLHRYLSAFNTEQVIGLTGSENDIKDLAKRYRIAYRPNDTKIDDDIIHSTVVYVFDAQGRARRVITPDDSDESITSDLSTLLTQPINRVNFR